MRHAFRTKIVAPIVRTAKERFVNFAILQRMRQTIFARIFGVI